MQEIFILITTELLKKVLILDIDGSLIKDENIHSIALGEFQEKIRYFSTFKALNKLENHIIDEIVSHSIYLIGNGDFHHLSYLLIKNNPAENIHVIVFDNHPDNMYIPFGIHCASWVYHAARLPNVRRVSVIGITSQDINGLNLVQNRFSLLRKGKVEYYCFKRVSNAAFLLSRNGIHEMVSSEKNLLSFIKDELIQKDEKIYLSIDKDVLQRECINTYWDQGNMTENQLFDCIDLLSENLIAADITGDLSTYKYKNYIKGLLRRLDGAEIPLSNLVYEREKHAALNYRIISHLKMFDYKDR